MTAWRESLIRETTAKREAAHSEFRLDPATLEPKEWAELHIAYRKNLLKARGEIGRLPYNKRERMAAHEYDEAALLSAVHKPINQPDGLFEDLHVNVLAV